MIKNDGSENKVYHENTTALASPSASTHRRYQSQVLHVNLKTNHQPQKTHKTNDTSPLLMDNKSSSNNVNNNSTGSSQPSSSTIIPTAPSIPPRTPTTPTTPTTPKDTSSNASSAHVKDGTDDFDLIIPRDISPVSDSDEFEFLKDLSHFYRKNRYNPPRFFPLLGNSSLNLHLLYKLVTERGGLGKITTCSKKEQEDIWQEIYSQLPRNYNPRVPNYAEKLSDTYKKFLLLYEAKNFIPSSKPALVSHASMPQPPISSSPTTESRTQSITFRFYLTKSWLTVRKQFVNEKPPHALDIEIELRDSPIVTAILNKLPILEHCNKFGEQLIYFTCPLIPETDELKLEERKTSREVIEYGTLAYWRAGSSLVFGWGKTPAAKNDECKLLEACSPIGKWKVKDGFEKSAEHLTNILAAVTHSMTQVQLKRRIDRVADKHSDMDYIVVEVQKTEFFKMDPQLQAQILAKQVFRHPKPPPSAPQKSASGPPPSQPSNITNLSALQLVPNHPSMVPPQMMRFPGMPQAPPPRDNLSTAKNIIDQKRKQMEASKQKEINEDESAKKPRSASSPTTSGIASNSPSTVPSPQPNGAEQRRVNPPSNSQLTYMLSRNNTAPGYPMLSNTYHLPPPGVKVNGAAKRPAEEELEPRLRKRIRLSKKIPQPLLLPENLKEVRLVANNQTFSESDYQLILKYKYKGESDSDSRLLRRVIRGENKQPTDLNVIRSDSDDEVIMEEPEIRPCITAGNIVHFLLQDNVEVPELDEIRYYERGPDEDNSGWVLMENDHRFLLQKLAGRKTIIKLLLKKL